MNIHVPAKLPRWNGIVYQRRRGVRGLGDDGDTYDLPTYSGPTAADVAVPNAQGVWDLPAASGAGSASSGSGSTLTASTVNTLATAGAQIGKTLAAEAAPSGSQLLYNAQGQLISATSIPTSLLSSLGSNTSSMVVWIALAALGFMALQGGRKQ